MNFNIDLSSDRTKAIIVIILFFLLALYNFYSIPTNVLEQMKQKLNERGHKIYAHQNRMIDEEDRRLAADSLNTNSFSAFPLSSEASSEISSKTPSTLLPQVPIKQVGGGNTGFPTQGLFYMQQGPNYRMSQWDQLQNTWDPIRLHDRYNVQSNPIVYQGFGIPLMSDLMCSSFADLKFLSGDDKMTSGKSVQNSNDRAVSKPTQRNVLGTIPSDEKSMFYFSDNISSPECCPGPYSSDAGCVCSFEKASFPLTNPPAVKVTPNQLAQYRDVQIASNINSQIAANEAVDMQLFI